MTKVRLAIFASGNGTNAEAIVNHFKDHQFVSVQMILTNNANAFVIERAKALQVPCRVFTKVEFRESDAIVQALQSSGITHVVLAGFLWLIPKNLVDAFPNRIINIHPALLPKHGGKGMYGLKVHEAVKASGDSVTGITIHLVNEHYDEGRVLFQASCEVKPEHTAEQIAASVHQLEYEHYPKVIEQWAMRLIVDN